RQTVEYGYERFNEKLDDLLSFISSTPKPSPLYRYHFPPKDFIRSVRHIFAEAPGMQGLLTKAEGRGPVVESINRVKRNLKRIPVLGPGAKGIYHWVKGLKHG